MAIFDSLFYNKSSSFDDSSLEALGGTMELRFTRHMAWLFFFILGCIWAVSAATGLLAFGDPTNENVAWLIGTIVFFAVCVTGVIVNSIAIAISLVLQNRPRDQAPLPAPDRLTSV